MAMIHPENSTNSSLLLGMLPRSEVEPYLVTEDADEWPTYKFLRVPLTIEELLPYSTSKGLFVCMGNGTLAYISDCSRLPPATVFTKYFEIISSLSVYILGNSDDEIVQTSVFFATLESSKKELEIHYSNKLSFDAARAEQLVLVIDKNRSKKICFHGSKLNSALTRVIATRPYPINLYLDASSIDGDAFVEHLQGRTALFGSLSWEFAFEANDLRRIFRHLHLFESLHVRKLPSDLILPLLSAPMKSIGFGVGAESRGMDLTKAEIVPKNIRMRMLYEEFPSRSMVTFLYRVAQLGHLESLDLSLRNRYPVPVDFGKALLCAISASTQLTVLELFAGGNALIDHMKDIFGILEKRERLHTLRISDYPETLDPHFAWLKQLLKRNRRLEVIDLNGKKWNYDDENIEEIYAVNRFFQGSERLTKEPTLIRLLLMGAAFTHRAAGDFHRAGLLLNDHTDMFCEILHEMEFSGRADEDSVTRAAQYESRSGQKRQRSEDED